MAFRLSASRSNSSPLPVISNRPERSPTMIRRLCAEIEAGARLMGALFDRLDNGEESAVAILVAETEQLRRDRVAELLVEDDVGLIGDVEDEEDREDREDRDIDRRQLEGGSADDLPDRRHLIMYPAPRTVCSSASPKPLSILARSREMWTSMTFVCGSK